MVFTPSPVKAFDQIVTDIVNFVQSRNPFIDVGANEIYRDILVESQADQFARLWENQNFSEQIQSLDNILSLDADGDYKSSLFQSLGVSVDTLQSWIDGYVENWGNNFSIPRRDAAFATGRVIFYTGTRPTVNVIVALGTQVATEGQEGVASVLFKTTQSATIFASNADAYFNLQTGLYEVEASVQAETAAKAGNVPVNTVSVVRGAVPLKVINRTATVGGADQESNADYIARIKDAFTSNFRGTLTGIRSLVVGYGSQVKDAYVAGTGDELEARGAGSVDVFVIGEQPNSFIESFSFVDQNDEYGLTKKPALSIGSVVGSSTGELPSAYYALDKGEAATTSGSSRGTDKIVWQPAEATKEVDLVLIVCKLTCPSALPDYITGNPLSPRIFVFRDGVEETSKWTYSDDTAEQRVIQATDYDSNAFYTVLLMPVVGDILTVTYWYNNLITALQGVIEEDENRILGQDVLVREATPVSIDVSLTVEIDSSTTPDAARNAVVTVITQHISTVSLGAEILQAEIVDAIFGDVLGVVNVVIPFTRLCRAGEAGTEDIQLENNEYGVAEVITVNAVQV